MNIDWNDALATGISQIDAQHKGFINLVNALAKTLATRRPDGRHLTDKTYKSQIVTIVMKMRDYAFFHFHTEEGAMRNHRYPEYIRHRREHDLFSTHLLRYEIAVLEGDYLQAQSLLEFASNWFDNHIRRQDLAFAHFLAASRT